MLAGQPFLYHSVIAQYLNCGLLDPLEVCRRVEAAFHAAMRRSTPRKAISARFIGWREYCARHLLAEDAGLRAAELLQRDAQAARLLLDGQTRMSCMREAIGQTKREAYAHHIRGLMVTGTFALIAGVSPQETHEWYLSVYADAYEWVELPNTLGMSQFADGGLLASKPTRRRARTSPACPITARAALTT